jgi:hypothetical protein
MAVSRQAENPGTGGAKLDPKAKVLLDCLAEGLARIMRGEDKRRPEAGATISYDEKGKAKIAYVAKSGS